MKQTLTIKQMQHLKKLGLELKESLHRNKGGMKMNEILKKRIDERLKIVEEGAVEFFTGEDSAVAAQYLELVKMAFTVGAEYALKSQWISIDEALPEEDPDLDKWLVVLVRVKTEEDSTVDVLQLGLYYGNGRFSCESRNIKAVAWMPIPKMEV